LSDILRQRNKKGAASPDCFHGALGTTPQSVGVLGYRIALRGISQGEWSTTMMPSESTPVVQAGRVKSRIYGCMFRISPFVFMHIVGSTFILTSLRVRPPTADLLQPNFPIFRNLTFHFLHPVSLNSPLTHCCFKSIVALWRVRLGTRWLKIRAYTISQALTRKIAIRFPIALILNSPLVS
jgi:hypothetical protein